MIWSDIVSPETLSRAHYGNFLGCQTSNSRHASWCYMMIPIMDAKRLSWCIYSNYDPPLFLFSIFSWKMWMWFFVKLCCSTKIWYILYIYILYIHFTIIMESKINDYQTPAEVKSWDIWTSRTFQLWWPSNRLLHLQFHPEAEVWAKMAISKRCDMIFGGFLWCCRSIFSEGYLLSPLSCRWKHNFLWCIWTIRIMVVHT